MTDRITLENDQFDKTNALLAGLVFLVSFIVYALTVQQSFSFWDCGEFIACAYSLGIPHPPGTPLFVILGRLFSLVPFVEDISHRMNYLSVLSSAFTAMLSYLLTVRMVGYFFPREQRGGLNRLIAYVGGIAGGFFVAFSRTNWANSVEAEVYGLALALSVGIVWMTLRYFEARGTRAAAKWVVMVFYLALLGIGIHMTVFLVVPVCSLFFIFKKEAETRDWLLVCGFIIIELLLIILFSYVGSSVSAFYAVSALMGVVLMVMLFRKINWAIVIAVASVSSVMMYFTTYEKATVLALVVLLILALLSKSQGWNLQWKTALAIVVVGFIGISIHAFIPIRSSLNPRIDENNPSRDWRTFENYLDRKQYGQVGMIERMFKRRGAWSNQFGRHPHMGFWSYFEEQYSSAGWSFIFPFFLLGIIGIVTAIRKRLEVGLPHLTLLLVCTIGLIMYMNFADGTKYNFNTQDAYLEVRNRDYFFTPAFVFFGITMGMGVAAVMQYLKNGFAKNPGLQRKVVIASSVMVLLPGVALAHNYHASDRSDNIIPYLYAANLLDTCEPNAILFTSGDNDTFPLWCIQEVYGYRLDVRVVNLSLLNTDWYVEQMKNRYDVPMSLIDSQIVWHPYEIQPGVEAARPKKMFIDRPRQRKTYLQPSPHEGRIVRVQDMMVDDIVWESTVMVDSTLSLRHPIYFSSPPYAESPLKLRDHIHSVGLLHRLDWTPHERPVDVDRAFDLFMNTYRYDGYSSSAVYRDENATGVFITVGVNAGRVFDELLLAGQRDKAVALAEKIIHAYPEYWQSYLVLAELYEKEGDTASVDQLWNQVHDTLTAFLESNPENVFYCYWQSYLVLAELYEKEGDTASADQLWNQVHDTLTAFLESNPENVFYRQDLGLTKMQLGQRRNDQQMIEDGIALAWEAFNANRNSNYGFRKLVTVLSRTGRFQDIQKAANLFAEYKINLNDPFLQQILGMSSPASYPAPRPGGE